MKINKWTLGLAAVGLVSLTSAVRADEVKQVPVMTALSATTISGYVDTSMEWNPGSGVAAPPYSFSGGKQDGFNVDAIDIKLQKALEEGQWSAGYVAELQYGPDATTPTAPIRQAYVELRAPVGNGLDFQIGQWDNLLGYESTDAYKNPNFTRSWGYTLEPTEHTGILASYKVNDIANIQIGLANMVTTGAGTGGINARNTSGTGGTTIESKKAIVSLLTLTAPDSMGFLKGSSLYAGLDYGPGSSGTAAGGGVDRTHLYLGTTLNTPIKDLTFGAAYDSVWNFDFAPGAGPTVDLGYAWSVAGYSTYKFSDKASFSARGEYAYLSGAVLPTGLPVPTGGTVPDSFKVLSLTGTFEYDLWANVISRLEIRWDHSADGFAPFEGGIGTPAAKKNSVLLAANVIYKF
jgi:hypothetical protein